MTSRHGLSHALRASRPLSRHFSYSRALSTSLRFQSTAKDGDVSDEANALSSKIRTLMRLTPHPLTAIISRSQPSSNPSGLLVSSFNTITLAPTPYVSFNIKLPSSTYSAIQSSCRFTASGISSADTAAAFVGDGDPWSLVDEEGRLKDGQGGTWWMRCQLVEGKCVEIGDHVVVVGEVLEAKGFKSGGSVGLVYAQGTYRFVGGAVKVGGK